MMKGKLWLAALVCVLALTGCSKPNVVPKGEGVLVPLPNLGTEEGIREYLVGQWIYDAYYGGDVVCTMDIDPDLNVKLSFVNTYSADPQGIYSGRITLDRLYARPDQVPDLLCIELIDRDEEGGDFFFLHRTIYDEKRVMSWFFAGNGSSVFDVLDFTEEFYNAPDEIIFEKVTGEKSQKKPRQDDEFYAVYWGTGADQKSLWLDAVRWTPPVEADDEQEPIYSRKMIHYENDIAESVLYQISPDEIVEILGDDLAVGEVYFVQTDAEGNVIHFIGADYKAWLEDGAAIYEIETSIFEALSSIDEIKAQLDSGMAVLFNGETLIYEEDECYDIPAGEYYNVAVGTNHDGHFVRETHYAVSIDTYQVYRYDVLSETYEPLAKG